MSRPSMSTSEVLINTRGQNSRSNSSDRSSDKPMHIAIIGDFSGRGSRGALGDLAKRKIIEIDRDNFDEVFSELGVTLALPFADEALRFKEFDDLHPDTLFNALPLFEKFRTLKRKLKNPELFQQAADEITQWTSQKPKLQPSLDDESGDMAPTNNMLDLVLARASSRVTSSEDNIDHLIRDIVAPYIEAKQDPRLPEFEAAVNSAVSQTMRKLMHSGAFQELEASWRGLYFLVRNLELNSKLKLFIIDISRDELVDDLINSSTLEDSASHALLVDKYRVPGAQAFSILQCDFFLQDDIDDLRIAQALAYLAQTSGAVAIGSASEKLAGCEALADHPDPSDWQYSPADHIRESWQQIRQDSSAAHLALVAPRVLLRMPYGKKSSPIDSFDFEELGDDNPHAFYCWGSGATVITLLIAQSYLASAWQFSLGQLSDVDNLPLHIYQDDGESVAKACAEIFMTDAAANKLAEAGILSLRSVKGRAAVTVSRFRSMSLSGSPLFA